MVEELLGLVTAVAMWDLEEVTREGRELVTANLDIEGLETATDVVVVVVVGVDDVAQELIEEELASALLRA